MTPPDVDAVPVAPVLPVEGSGALRRLTINGSGPLAGFLGEIKPRSLSDANRQFIIDQAIALLKDFYVHRPVKERMYAADPIGELEKLAKRLPGIGKDLEFHRQMCNIFALVRDLHTNYLLPAPYNDKVAFLPFNVEACFRNGERIYVISKVTKDFAGPKPGAEVVRWNGQPIEAAIEALAGHNPGSNPAAHHARGVSRLTFRALAKSPPPEPTEVTIRYRAPGQHAKTFKTAWRVDTLPPEKQTDDANVAAMLAVDLEADLARRTRKHLYRPDILAKQEQLGACGRNEKEIHNVLSGWQSDNEIPSSLPGILEASIVRDGDAKFGLIRIRTFHVELPTDFVSEFMRLLTHERMPQKGLIIDVRDNGGGAVAAAEGILQLLTPKHIDGQPMQFINTERTLRLCQVQSKVNHDFLGFGKWVDSIQRGVEKTGAQFSVAYPISEESFLNGQGQCYYGPVVLIVNALSYSATDLFAAGFKDHDVGDILGTDENTGAGGGNVFTYDQLCDLINQPAEQVLKPLPDGVGFRVALRRSLRLGKAQGTELEDFGIAPIELRYPMTQEDVVGRNEGLIKAVIGLLLKKQDRVVVFKPRLDHAGEGYTSQTRCKERRSAQYLCR